MGKKHTSNKVIVETILATGMSHKDAAALFNVSTRWIRELLHRYREGGYQALQPRSRRPHSNPRQVPESTVKTILEIRQHLENTGQDNGAHTIRWHLQQQKITPTSSIDYPPHTQTPRLRHRTTSQKATQFLETIRSRPTKRNLATRLQPLLPQQQPTRSHPDHHRRPLTLCHRLQSLRTRNRHQRHRHLHIRR